MNWKLLTEEEKISEILNESNEKLVLIFKNSTRCSTSALALNRLERDWKEEEMKDFIPYYVDVIRDRNVSLALESALGVTHQSPQVLVVKNGKAVYDESHLGISYREILKQRDKISV